MNSHPKEVHYCGYEDDEGDRAIHKDVNEGLGEHSEIDASKEYPWEHFRISALQLDT